MLRVRKFLGIIELKTGVAIITVFAIINKLSGFFGVFANGGLDKIIMSLYSVLAAFIFAWCLYGVLVDNTKIVSRYALAYIFDVALNAIQTIVLAVTWFLNRDKILMAPDVPDISELPGGIDQGTTPVSPSSSPVLDDSVRQGFEFEGGISILILLGLWCLHFYCAAVVWSYSVNLVHRYDLPTREDSHNVGKSGSGGMRSDDTPLGFLTSKLVGTTTGSFLGSGAQGKAKSSLDRGNHSILRNEDEDDY